MGILVAILVLSVLIVIHELGHFLAARLMGVTVEVFSLGFGKRLWAKKIGATEWRVSAFWIGGYVQMKGQNDADPTARSGEPDAYDSKKPWRRIFILFAGPFANFVLAFFLFLWAALIGYETLAPVIGKIMPDSPAEKAGLIVGDRVIAINKSPIASWNELSDTIRASEGEVELLVDRAGEKLTLILKPELAESQNIFGEKEQRKMIGISPSGAFVAQSFNISGAIAEAWDRTIFASTIIFQSVIKLISGAISPDNVGGVITIVDLTSKASEIGIAALLMFSALISVNLGVLNLLPIPALDGGHIMFNIYEQIARRAPSEKALYRMTYAGWVVLGALMLLGLYNDIARLTGKG
ncbi:MAG: RIP metalloprotease RseP [Helicobacteraceae bacterium]|jgi:regulator of sigma E protease|nr:RIP metalloprotease RseP [Helicobacteraceae bacterium]